MPLALAEARKMYVRIHIEALKFMVREVQSTNNSRSTKNKISVLPFLFNAFEKAVSDEFLGSVEQHFMEQSKNQGDDKMILSDEELLDKGDAKRYIVRLYEVLWSTLGPTYFYAPKFRPNDHAQLYNLIGVGVFGEAPKADTLSHDLHFVAWSSSLMATRAIDGPIFFTHYQTQSPYSFMDTLFRKYQLGLQKYFGVSPSQHLFPQIDWDNTVPKVLYRKGTCLNGQSNTRYGAIVANVNFLFDIFNPTSLVLMHPRSSDYLVSRDLGLDNSAAEQV